MNLGKVGRGESLVSGFVITGKSSRSVLVRANCTDSQSSTAPSTRATQK